VLMDVSGIEFDRIKADRADRAPFFVLRGVKDFATRAVSGMPDVRRESVENESL
jgi:hypothetical protein